MKLKIIKNPNEEEYNEISQAVEGNDGFCPCLTTKSPNTKCICKVFREQTTEGSCHCGRFLKVLVD